MSENSPHTNESLESFGYKQEMKRELGWYTSFAVAFGFVSIATGIFTTYGSVLGTSGPIGIWAWPIVVIGQLMVALIFGALVARIPVSGYAYQWISRLANPVAGWIMGWVSFTFLAVVVVAVDYTIASTIIPSLLNYEGTSVNCWAITAGVMLLQAILVAWSTRATQRINNVAVTIQLIGMILLTVLLYIVGISKDLFNWSMLFEHAQIPTEGYFHIGSATHAGPFALAFMLGAFTIVGFESAANLAEETKDPERAIPKAMWQAVLSLGILGFAFIVAVTGLLGDPVLAAQSATPVADTITNVLGDFVGKALLVLVVISIFSCGLVITLSGSRLVWAMSRDKRFPGWRFINYIHPDRKTPVHAAIFMQIVSQVILATFSFSEDALFALFSAGTLLPALIYAGTVLLYALKRRQLPPTHGFKLGKAEIPVLIVSGIWLLYELALFRDESFRDPWMYVLIMFAIGGIYFAILYRKIGKDGLSMPEMTDIDRELDAAAEEM